MAHRIRVFKRVFFFSIPFLLSLLACSAPAVVSKPVAPTPRPLPIAQPSASPLQVQIVPFQESLTGTRNLVVGWYTAKEFKSRRRLPIGHLMELVGRLHVVPVDVTSKEPVELELEVPADVEVVSFALLDVHQDFWHAWFGGAKGDTPWGHSKPIARRDETVLLPLNQAFAAHVFKERCVEERMVLVEFESPRVKGRAPWQNPTTQKLCVFLPLGYNAHPQRRYPTVYMLPGLFSDYMANMGKSGVRSVVAETGREVILVGVDGRTATGSSYFVDGPVNGDWLHHISHQVVKEVDARFRTHRSASARGLVGQSTGGFNAISIAMRKPEVFGAAVASAPDGLDLESWVFPDGETMDKDWLTWLRFEHALGSAGQMTSYVAAFSPDPERVDGLLWPIDLATGEPTQPGWARWQAANPYRWLDDAAMVESLKKHLTGRLFIEAAPDDEFKLGPPARRFSEKLNQLGVEHHFGYHNGGHGGSQARFKRAVPRMLELLTAPEDP